jgi:hypothetical protein
MGGVGICECGDYESGMSRKEAGVREVEGNGMLKRVFPGKGKGLKFCKDRT